MSWACAPPPISTEIAPRTNRLRHRFCNDISSDATCMPPSPFAATKPPSSCQTNAGVPNLYPKAGLWSNNVKKAATRSGRLVGQRERSRTMSSAVGQDGPLSPVALHQTARHQRDFLRRFDVLGRYRDLR